MPTPTDDPHTKGAADPTVSATEPERTIEQTTAPTATPPADTGGGRTAAEHKLWTALLANPLRTAEELANAAGIGRSTANKILTRWTADTTVTRTAGTADGARRTADRWSITEPDLAPATTPAPGETPLESDVTAADIDIVTAEPHGPNTDQDSAEEKTGSESVHIEAEALDTEEETKEQTELDPLTEPRPPDAGDDHEADSEHGPDSAPADADGDTESADSVGVIELGNGIMLIYPMATFSTPVSCADGSACGMVDLLRLLAAVSMTTKPARKAGAKRFSEPREPGMNRSGTPRLAKGALRGMVEDFLFERPGEEFVPNAIATALGRSSGAVANALDQMEADEVVTMTSEKPRRYAIAASE